MYYIMSSSEPLGLTGSNYKAVGLLGVGHIEYMTDRRLEVY